MAGVEERIARTIDEIFYNLYEDLRDGFPFHPFDWIGVMLMPEPRWWQFRLKRERRKLRGILAKHGFVLTPASVVKFQIADPQRHDEDAGGAIMRQLREAFGPQMGPLYQNSP